jgi:ABC-type transport system involved in cytochrome c biogenesis permease component
VLLPVVLLPVLVPVLVSELARAGFADAGM